MKIRIGQFKSDIGISAVSYNSFIKLLIYSNSSHWKHAIIYAKQNLVMGKQRVKINVYVFFSRTHTIHQVLYSKLLMKEDKLVLSDIAFCSLDKCD